MKITTQLGATTEGAAEISVRAGAFGGQAKPRRAAEQTETYLRKAPAEADLF